MNVLARFWTSFCLAGLAFSFSVTGARISKYTPASWRRSGFDVGQQWQSVNGDGPFSVHQAFGADSDQGLPTGSDQPRSRGSGVATPEAAPDGSRASAYVVTRFKPYPFPGQKMQAIANFNRLLCVTDCRMADLVVFQVPDSRNRSFHDVPLAGRPYTFSTLREWCNQNCRPNAGRGKQSPVLRFSDVAGPPRLPFLPFGKPAGVFPAVLIQPPSLFPFPSVLPTSLAFRDAAAAEEEPSEASGVGFRSFRGFPGRIHQFTNPLNQYHQFRHRPEPDPTDLGGLQIEEDDDDDDDLDRDAEAEDDGYDEIRDDEDDEDETAEDEELDPAEVTGLLKRMLRLLKNKDFRSLLDKAPACDEGTDSNTTAEP